MATTLRHKENRQMLACLRSAKRLQALAYVTCPSCGLETLAAPGGPCIAPGCGPELAQGETPMASWGG